MGAKRTGPAIGIDLGTCYSCVGVWKNGRVQIIPDNMGNRTTPSYVTFTPMERFIGDAAKDKATGNPTSTIFNAKRLIGRRFSDASVQSDMKCFPFKIIQGPADRPLIVVNYKGEEKHFTAEEMLSMVLIKMRETAEAYLGYSITKAVVSVPAHFNDSQRQATMDAGAIAGLDVLRIVNDPSAAAMAYGIHKHATFIDRKNVLIFDLGAGTFDVSVVTIEKEIYQVKSVAGDDHLGGEDINNRMVNHFVREIQSKHKKDISGDPKAMTKLRTSCEKAKRDLSSIDKTTILMESLYQGDFDWSLTITRSTFDELNKDLFERCIELVRECLRDAKQDKSTIHEIVLVGGSTRIPKVQQMLRDFFDGKELCKSVNLDEAVAYGAAIQAAMLSGEDYDAKEPDIRFFDVTSFSLGTESAGGYMDAVIPRHTFTAHLQKMKEYTTKYDNQSDMLIRVYEGERLWTKYNNLLGEFKLSGIPLARKGVPQFTVNFHISANGILTVSAEDKRSVRKNKIVVTNTSTRGLSKAEIIKKIKEAKKYKSDDDDRKNAIDMKDTLERYVNGKKNELKAKTNIMRDADRTWVLDALEDTIDWLENNEFLHSDKYKRRLSHLEYMIARLQR